LLIKANAELFKHENAAEFDNELLNSFSDYSAQ